MEEKLSLLLKEKIALTGCGRTDTGVNARDFVAHFESLSPDLAINKAHWIYKLNTVLPPGIAVSNIRQVTQTAHARYDATLRVYHYYLSRRRNPFRDAFTWYVHGGLDFERMNRAAAILPQYQDFSSFSKSNTQVKTNVCKISEAVWKPCGEQEWRFTIKADRFLRGMVRAIVGTLVMVGRDKLSLDDFRKIIEARDRKMAGGNAPAKALFLSAVQYPQNIYFD